VLELLKLAGVAAAAAVVVGAFDENPAIGGLFESREFPKTKRDGIKKFSLRLSATPDTVFAFGLDTHDGILFRPSVNFTNPIQSNLAVGTNFNVVDIKFGCLTGGVTAALFSTSSLFKADLTLRSAVNPTGGSPIPGTTIASPVTLGLEAKLLSLITIQVPLFPLSVNGVLD
jgi:hypothetical protein